MLPARTCCSILECVAEKLSKHLPKLSKRGPHRVLTGDLAYAGLPGKVYAPAEGNAIPGVVFAHDWMKGIEKYHGFMKHLASWGFAVTAPDTERGINPNALDLAADIESCIQILTGVKLGTGNITVSPGRIGIVGHGLGAGAAVLAAAGRENIQAVAALYPSQVSPSATDAATNVEATGMVLGAGELPVFDYGNAPLLAAQWKGDVVYREIDKATHSVVTEDSLFKLLTGTGRVNPGLREQVRGLTTGFLLSELATEKKYSAFSDPEAEGKKITSYWGEKLAERANITKM